MDINEIYSIVQFISNKNQSGYIGPVEFNNAFNLAQKQYFHQIVEDIQGWDANRRRVRLAMGNAQQSIQKVAPFIVSVPVSVAGTGQYPKPADMANLLAIRSSDNAERVWRVEHDRVATHISSVIDPPTEIPIYTEYSSYYQFYPIDIGTVNIEYLKLPPDANWAYTVVSGRPVYDLGSSTQSLWNDTEITDIIIRVLFMFGISIQANQLVQYYGSVKNEGQ
jgi:hypothetical protein